MSWITPTLFTLTPQVGGAINGYLTRKNIKGWYEHLKRPDWRPPNWAFPPVWTSLYAGMGYASYLVWRDGGGFDGEAKTALAVYGTQLALNWAWTPIFFGAKKLGWAAVEIVGLWAGVAGCVVTFYPINRTASYLMMPYLAWVTFATALNINVWKNNRGNSIKAE